MVLIQVVCFLLSFVLFIGANVSANKYKRRALETKGVFPVLEAKEDYEYNKRTFEKKQSTGLIAPNCKPCPPFDPEAVEKGETHCAIGLKPVKRCDVKCGCESWDCVRENCDVWIKANAKNFTGPCINDKTGDLDACQARTKEEWNCGCKIMACEHNCEKSRPLPVTFKGCDKDCSFQVYDECSCPVPTCSPFVPPTTGHQRCEESKDCRNPKCEHCKKTKPYGNKCAELFPKEHVIGECKRNPPNESPCNICKNEVTIITGEDKVCGDPVYKCETKPEAKAGVCEYCETPLTLPADHCKGKNEGGNVTLCDRKDPLPTQLPCTTKEDCDFCRETVEKMPVDKSKRCPTCPEEKCVAIEITTTPKPTAPAKCCTGNSPAGKLETIRDHPKCEETVCVLDCDLREAALHCDPCTQTVETTDKTDDCGCQIKKCVDLPPVIEAPEEGCGDCLKKVAQSKNPANKECKETVEICVKIGAIFQIVKNKKDIVLPNDSEDPENKYVDDKKELFKLANEKIIKEMEPEEFLKALNKVPENVPVKLDGGKVVVKTKPKEQKPGEEKPPEYIVKPETEEEMPTLKVFVFLMESCPNIGEETQCHLKGKTPKICDCVIHEEIFPVEKCDPPKCATECVELKNPDGTCDFNTYCPPDICERINMTLCDDEIHKERSEVELCKSEDGNPSCMVREVKVKYKRIEISAASTDKIECCKEIRKPGECIPRKCPVTKCDDVCEERRVVQESDACGCTKHKCVARTKCSETCGECEICSKAMDNKKQCQTYKCIPKPAPNVGKCQTIEKDENGVVREDKCGHPIVITKCGPKAQMPNPCPKGKVRQQVYDECGCSLCEPQCCVNICKNMSKTCGECEEKKTIPINGGQCKEEICVDKNCAPPKQVDCPSCMQLENKPSDCGCMTSECVSTPCKKINKSLKCKEYEKLVVKKDSCGCVTTICEVQACKAECGKGEICKETACKCEKTTSECLTRKADADSRSGMGSVGHFTPSCEADGSYSAEQCHGSTGFCWCALADGKEVPGTRGRGFGSNQVCSVHRGTKSTPCRQMRAKMLLTSLKLPDVVVPECDPDTGAYLKP